MDNSNKAIAKRINKELRIRGWKQTDLLKKIITFQYPNYSKSQKYAELLVRKGNFSTALKPKSNRSITKEELYIISKILYLPLEYLWFGDEKKSDFIPSGARYVAFQDSESEYRTYIGSLEHEDMIQYDDEFGFNLFEYMGQYESINGFKLFAECYHLNFDYVNYHELAYVNGEGFKQFCCNEEKSKTLCANILSTLVKNKDKKTFKAIFFDNCSIRRFWDEYSHNKEKRLFNDDFLKTLLQNELFFELILFFNEIDLNCFDKRYGKGEKRIVVEPMIYEALSFALENEKEYENQLIKMLRFALEYNKAQFEFINNYFEENTNEYGDVRVNEYAPRSLISSRNIPMGNIFRIKEQSENNVINDLINKIEQLAFNMTHIKNPQEKTNEEIKVSTPDNSLFIEMHEKANEQKATFVPTVTYLNKEFTHFKYYESQIVNFENPKHIELIIDCLEKVQSLVTQKSNKVLVHGNLNGSIIMCSKGEIIGLAGWQKCHYGSKYEDRAEILTNIDIYAYGEEFLEKYNELFDIVAKGFNKEEKIKLIDTAIDLLNERRKAIRTEGKDNLSRAFSLKNRASRLEFYKEQYLDK